MYRKVAAPHQALAGIIPGPPVPLPTFTFASSETATSIDWPAGHQVNDIGILIVVSCNQAVSTPAGWNIINTPLGFGGGAGAVRATEITAFWRRATSSSEATVTIADSGTMQVAVMNAFRGADLSGSPIEAIATDDTDALNPTVVPSTTTLGRNRYVIGATSGGGDPATTNQSNCAWTTNANLVNFVELADSAFNGAGGTGGSVAVFGGAAITPTVVGTTSGTLVDAGNREHCIFALKPAF